MQVTPDERRAIILYAALNRDPVDFIDMVRERETTDDCLEMLYAMLVTPNPRSDSELNKIGAGMIRPELEKRGILFRPALTRWLNERDFVSGDWSDNVPEDVRKAADREFASPPRLVLDDLGWPTVEKFSANLELK